MFEETNKMNRTFKTVWSTVRQQYVVSDEKHASHGKAAKATMAAVAVAAAFAAGAAGAAYVPATLSAAASGGTYVEQGVLGNVQSWESAEYKKDWGLTAMNASSAYALGFHGQGVNLAVMDSGALLYKHPELNGDRFHATHATGQFGSTGVRYPQGAGEQFDADYEKGESFDITGEWILNTNDSHGTHVTGTVGGNRDGSEFHGVAWGADVYVGNTGGTDDSNYGPFLDHDFFLAGWSAIVKDINSANALAGNPDRGGVINNSFGTNTRVVNNGSTGYDGYNTSVHLPVNTTAQTEYEYFLFNQVYGPDQSFVDAAWEAVKDTNVIQVMTTGNRDMANPYYRPLYPYFNPEAEQNWIAVAGLKKLDGEGENAHYGLIKNFNEAGNAKWWTVVGPGDSIYSSAVVDGSYVMPGKGEGEGLELTDPTYAAWGGTSMAAPHVTGAMGVLMSRYSEMTAVQVRDVLFTTASHTNPDGTIMDGWVNTDGTTPAEGEVSDRMGWGVPDLEKGMYGPGQLLGKFEYNMRAGTLDVWTNDITEVALNQRQREDAAWKAAAQKWLKNPTLTLGDEFTAEEKKLIGDIILDTSDDIVGLDAEQEKISEKDAIAWRKAYFEKRLQAIAARAYDGSLVKRGEGTLILTGHNTYEGGTVVEGGTLWGFADSFGVTVDKTKAVQNGQVTVKGGSFGIMTSYEDELTGKGTITDNAESAAENDQHSVDVTVQKGGTYLLSAGENATAGKVKFEEGAKIGVGSPNAETLKQALTGEKVETTLDADIEGFANAKLDNSARAFFETELSYDEKTGEISAQTTHKEGSFTAYGSSSNAHAIGAALAGSQQGALFDQLLIASADQVTRTYDSLASDAFLNAQNASIVNTVTLTRAIKDQAQGIGGARVAEMADGTARIWATGIGSWGDLDYGNTSIDNDFYAGLIGAEVDVCPAAKVGVFFGAGTSEFDGGKAGKLESDDIHFGIYAQTNIQDVVGVNFGFTYTQQDREGHRSLTVGSNSVQNQIDNDAKIAQIFVEGAYTGFNTNAFSVEPYVGFSWMHVQNDDFSENVGGVEITTDNQNQNVEMTTLGIRGAIPFTIGSVSMSVKGDVNWMHFFGDTSAEALLGLGGSGVAKIEGGELDNMFGVGLGIEAQLTKATTFGLSYTGAYDGDVSSSGLFANLRFAF